MSAFEEAQAKRNARYDEIKHLASSFKIERTPGYAHYQYRATTSNINAMKLSAGDVALIVDSGNLCFGGRNWGKRESDEEAIFTGVVHTD